MDDWGEEIRKLMFPHCSLNPETSSPFSRNAIETCMIETAPLFNQQMMVSNLKKKKKVCAKLLTERKFTGIIEEKPTSYCNSIRKSNKPWDKSWDMEMFIHLELLNINSSPPLFPRLLVNLVQDKNTIYYQETLRCHKRCWRCCIRIRPLRKKKTYPTL